MPSDSITDSSASSPAEPSAEPSFDPLTRWSDIITLIQAVTDEPESTVRQRLEAELEEAGTNVRRAFAESDATAHVYNDAMEAFYENTDAFLYELAVWNLNTLKTDMGRWIAKRLKRYRSALAEDQRPLRVLSLGDGLGFECLRFARQGHDVTYFEVPGKTAQFAQAMLARAGEEGRAIQQLTDPTAIPREHFDAVVCLDVLEHVPDPPAFAKMIVTYLKPGGVLFVHAPYYMIHPSYPTHVRTSRRYSGSLKLYRDAGLRLLEGRPFWHPLALQKQGGAALPCPLGGRLAVRAGQPYLRLARWMSAAMLPAHWLKPRTQNRWQ